MRDFRPLLALGILLLWGWLVIDARGNPSSATLVATITPIALAAATYLFAVPILDARRKRKNGDKDEAES